MRHRQLSVTIAASIVMLLGTVVAHAHPGHYHPPQEVDEFEQESFTSAVTHPFTGLDHLTAALAVGGLAISLGRRSGSALAASFAGSLALGAVLGQAGSTMPMIEQGLAVSVIAAGALLMFASRTSSAMRLAIVAAMGFWHGNAHGSEMSGAMSCVGLLLGTATAVALGAACTRLITARLPVAARYAGGAVAAIGLVLCVARLA